MNPLYWLTILIVAAIFFVYFVTLLLTVPVTDCLTQPGCSPINAQKSRNRAQNKPQQHQPWLSVEPLIEKIPDCNPDNQRRDKLDADPHREPQPAATIAFRFGSTTGFIGGVPRLTQFGVKRLQRSGFFVVCHGQVRCNAPIWPSSRAGKRGQHMIWSEPCQGTKDFF